MTVNLTPSTRNVTRVYRAATAAQIADGVEWYARARRIAGDLALSVDVDSPLYGDVRASAAVLALTSPLTPWGRNVWLAREAYRMWAEGEASPIDSGMRRVSMTLPTLKANARKVARVLNGEDPAAVVSGLKVTAFWLTIADPTNPHAVVVDRHAYDVAVGKVTNDVTRGKGIGTPKRYAELAACYARAAVILSRESGETVLPSQVQAVTWVAWRQTMIRTAAAMRAENVA
jgi:hypothetical protein